MTRENLTWMLLLGLGPAFGGTAEARDAEACRALTGFVAEGLALEITRAEWVAPGPADPNPFGVAYPGELPRRCRVKPSADQAVVDILPVAFGGRCVGGLVRGNRCAQGLAHGDLARVNQGANFVREQFGDGYFTGQIEFRELVGETTLGA